MNIVATTEIIKTMAKNTGTFLEEERIQLACIKLGLINYNNEALIHNIYIN